MKKIINKLLVISIILLCLSGIYIGISYANSCGGSETQSKKITLHKLNDPEVDEIKIGCDYELAMYAKKNPIKFMKSNLTKKIGNRLTKHNHSNEENYTIKLMTAQCMYHKQSDAEGKEMKYKIATVIDIEGSEIKVYSKDHLEGEGIPDNNSNKLARKKIAQMAYCIKQSMNNDLNNDQREEWKDTFSYIFNQTTKVKNLVDKDFLSESNWNPQPKYVSKLNEAEKYANNIRNKQIPEKVSTPNEPREHREGEAIYLGPFKIDNGTYTPEKFRIIIDDNYDKEKTTYYTKENGTYVPHDLGDEKIKNNKAFYLRIPEIKEKWKIELNLKYEDTISARIVLLSELLAEAQNLSVQLACDGAVFNMDEKKLVWKGEIPDEPELKILKVDEDDNTPIPDVGFTLRHIEKGYLKQDGTYTYNESEATTFYTDKNGEAKFKNIKSGYYVFKEIVVPDPKYKANTGKEAIFSYNDEETITIKIKNKPTISIDIPIKKIGKRTDGSEEPLSGVGFKLKHQVFGYVTKSSNGEWEYRPDFNAAEEFFTESDGTKTISNLKPGNYTFIETQNPHSGYEMCVGTEQDFQFKENNTEPIVIVNKEEPRGSLIISKLGIKDGEEPKHLSHVRFKIKHETEGYVKSDGGYTKNEWEAAEFETGEDGLTDRIDNLIVGYYTIIETYNDNEDFTENVGKTFIKEVTAGSSPSSPVYANIENPSDDTGKLRIIKKGNNGKLLSGVRFKVKNNISGYVYDEGNGKIGYTQNESQAYEFTTGDQNPFSYVYSEGTIYIDNLKVGDYTVYETYNPNKPYVTYPNLTFTKDSEQRSIVVKPTKEADWVEFTFTNHSIRGNLKIKKIDEVTKEPLKDVVFVLENKEGYVQSIGKDVVYTSNKESAQPFITDDSGMIEIEGLEVGDYTIHEIENKNDGYERYPNKTFEATVTENNGDTISWDEYEYGNPPQRGKITIVKKVEDTNVPMGGIGFIIEHKGKGFVSSSGTKAEYSDDRDDAEIFYTDTEGKVTIEGLLVGEYNIYEVENNYYGFEINPDEPLGDPVNLSSTDNNLEVEVVRENKQKYIKLRGYVWEELIAGKESRPNDLYDVGEERLNGIPVYLKEGDTIIAETATHSVNINDTEVKGIYEFTDVEVDKLGNYYIEFEYDGLTYTNVVVNINADNGSKAAEPKSERTALNEKFATIERGDKEDRHYGVAKDPSGNPTLDLKYDYANHEAKIDKDSITKHGEEINPWIRPESQITITANTNEAQEKYIENRYKALKETQIVEWIDNINLGIYQREQPDIALVKDIQSIKINANKKSHVYEYANRFDNRENPDESGRFGVEYGSKFKEETYERPVYKEDYNCAIRNNNPTQFEVYITYKIALRNESTSLVTQVNSIVDYYDARYEIKAIGNKYTSEGAKGEEGAKVEDVNKAINGYSNPEDIKDNSNKEYKKTVINLNNMKIQHQTNSCIYVQFKLTTDGIKSVLQANGTTDLYKNVAEINSYSTYYPDGETIYAGIDVDSAPNNIVLGDTSTYEDDVDIAPAMRLKITETRTMQGKVFLDQTTGELKTGEIREGNGELDGNDKPIQGIEILLKELSGSENTYSATTDANGEFKIEDYIAGDYELIYTWGGQKVKNDKNEEVEITLQNYKATVYKDKDRQNNKKWHLQADKRYSDAFDNMNTREKIDNELKILTNNEGKGYNANKTMKMKSTTPEMNIEVEYDTLISSGNTEHTYAVQNIDFGIVRRAKQSVKLEKRVKKMTITLANGQVVSEIEIDKKGGIIIGDATKHKHITYMGPLNDSAGFVKAELDNELLQGSKVEVIYEFKFKNISEVDIAKLEDGSNADNYDNYYKYGSDAMSIVGETVLKLNGASTGKRVDNKEIVTITPPIIVDYLDRDWGYEKDKNPDWDAKTKEEFIEEYIKKDDGTIVKLINTNVIDNTNSKINNRIILITEKWRDKKVLPGGDEIADLSVSKTLTTTDEISLGNETEIVKLEKPGGSEILEEDDPGPGPVPPKTIIPGSHIPGQSPEELDTDESETVIVIPSTGANLAIVIPITIAVIALVILGTGIVLIKKKVIDIKK